MGTHRTMATEVFEDVNVTNDKNTDATEVKQKEVIEVNNKEEEQETMLNEEEEKEEEIKSNVVIRAQRSLGSRTLRILSTEERKGRVAKHTVYIIECDPKIPGVITVARRYNDFKWLRNVLCAQFPGLFVPPLPPANVIGRFEDSFIEERRQDLERFLNRIEETKAFSESVAFLMFLSRPETTLSEGKKECEDGFVARSESEIAAILNANFADLCDQELDADVHSDQIPQLVEFLTKIDLQMTAVNKSALRLFKHLHFVSAEMCAFESAFDGLYSAESNYPYKATAERLDVRNEFKLWATYQTKQTDSYYDHFFRSLRYEHEDIKALLELFKFHELKFSKLQKINERIKKIEDAETNGTPLNDKQEKQREGDKEKRKECKALLDIVTKIIMKNEMIAVWNNKTTAWRDKVQQFSKIQIEITNKMISNWKNIAVVETNEQ